MRCPDPIGEILTEILQLAMLRIRCHGQEGESRKCVYESDHVHNLPALLSDYRPELLASYWNVERPLLIKQMGEHEASAFQELWGRLAQFAPAESNQRPQSNVPELTSRAIQSTT
ncbi:MAG TPA: hypothetical protein VMP01_20740 [Pirellulaceae bacterium]|nr:hypothetical protein [Pirellulaceae bacterium]